MSERRMLIEEGDNENKRMHGDASGTESMAHDTYMQ